MDYTSAIMHGAKPLLRRDPAFWLQHLNALATESSAPAPAPLAAPQRSYMPASPISDLEARLTAETRKLDETKASHEQAQSPFVHKSKETIAGLETERGELLVRIERVEKEAQEKEQKLQEEVRSAVNRAERAEQELEALKEKQEGWNMALQKLSAQLGDLKS